ncbi:MAG: endolytic transglycosylase MltG [Flavobacteriales bacterium AspAUS03]
MRRIKILLWGIILSGTVLTFHHYYLKLYGANVKRSGYLLIPTGSTYEEVLNRVTIFLKDPEAFTWVAEKKNYPQRVKSGKYALKAGEDNVTLVDRLRSGQQEEVDVIFGGQNSIKEFTEKIAQQIELDSTALLKTILNPYYLKEHQVTTENVQQLFISNTYKMYWNTSIDFFLAQMIKEYHRFWNKTRRDKSNRLGMSVLQIITLASIVQKEASKVDEMPKVAGLYLNRLRRHWKLQSDPTVLYAIKKMNPDHAPIKRVLYEDLQVASPYNTYLHHGLPPAPICLPEISAINAVLDPTSHSYYYMVVSVKRPGYHEFSQTDLEHETHRHNYIRSLNEKNIRR